MAYVVTGACVDCVYTSCVDVCPVEAFHETPDRLLINPDTCVNCDACVPECPVEAIYAEENVPEELTEWIEINQDAENHPIIPAQKDPKKGPKCVDPNAA
ncbi:MAG: ferredoxin family protein [Verrucomicrobiota bacterium]|nr:ferredoxin family protein [Verrucomicrobiota bacterium]